MKDAADWHSLSLAADTELLRKEWFSYRARDDWFDIELFETSTGQYYAIGTPADKEHAIVYGSRVVDSALQALAQTIRKIDRDQFGHTIRRVGEDNEPFEPGEGEREG